MSVTIRYHEQVPRADLMRWFVGFAMLLLGLLLIADLLEVRAWR